MSFKNFKKRILLKEFRDGINISGSLEDMTKQELDEYALVEKNIELDRRKSKPNMIKDLLAKLKGET